VALSDGENVSTREPAGWGYSPTICDGRIDLEFGSIPNAVRIAARSYDEDEAIVDRFLRMTCAELEHAMHAAVKATIAMGIQPGDRVAVTTGSGWSKRSASTALAASRCHSTPGSRAPRRRTSYARAGQRRSSWPRLPGP
jgi:hypothetical protein